MFSSCRFELFTKNKKNYSEFSISVFFFVKTLNMHSLLKKEDEIELTLQNENRNLEKNLSD